MKHWLKPISFLAIMLVLDILFRMGIIAFLIPIPLTPSFSAFILFALFAVLGLFITNWFAKKDRMHLSDVGITLDSKNRRDVFFGFLIGVVLWTVVSLAQSWTAGFSWNLQSEISILNLVHGLIFIFVADLGTEIFTRGYPLTRLRNQSGSFVAITFMVFFVGLKSYSPNVNGELLFYTMLIPALHTIFFSIIFFKTKRLGGALGVHTGANFATISLFDLRPEQSTMLIPSGLFRADVDFETISINALQLPYVVMAVIFSVAVYLWWRKYPNLLSFRNSM